VGGRLWRPRRARAARLSYRAGILEGIGAELTAASEPVRLTITGREELGGGVWALAVDPGRRAEGRFDESLEAARAYWPGGGGDVAAVITDPPAVHLRFVARRPPPVGDFVWLYPPRFLEPLMRVWQRDDADDIASLLDGCGDGSAEAIAFAAPRPPEGAGLRDRQREAFGLVARRLGFLDGPPGTGKTHTVGSLIAAAIEQGAAPRVLLVSTTNAAVDLALLQADARASLTSPPPPGRFVRSGYHYAPERYAGREHLLPEGAAALLAALAAVHARKPPRADAARFAAWRGAEESARRRLRLHAARARRGASLVAMTVANALALFDELVDEPFDLVVFDEASQIGRAAALAVARLGRRALFAGDPRQLGPVVVSDDAAARRWLGTSMFLHRTPGAPNACFLDEQSRMAPAICGIVSDVFYEGRLRLATSCARDAAWRAERRLDRPGFEGVSIVPVASGGGRVRLASIRAAVDQARGLLAEGFEQGELLFLTPFRRQREALRSALDGAGLGQCEASTVHRAQGREAPVVVFDPVDEASDFLAGEAGRLLVNVALSRAQARLVLLVARDRLGEAPLLRMIIEAAESPRAAAPGGEGGTTGKYSGAPGQAAPFRLGELGPLVASGASLVGARLALAGRRWCEVTSWDPAARRGEGVDSTGRPLSLAAPAAPAPPAVAAVDVVPPGIDDGGKYPWLEPALRRTLSGGFGAAEHLDAAARVARVEAAALASRLAGVRGLRGELGLAIALERRGRPVSGVCLQARSEGGAVVFIDVLTAAGSAVALIVPRAPGAPASLGDVARWARCGPSLVGGLARGGVRVRGAYCWCSGGFERDAGALLRARGVVALVREEHLGEVP
jgi:DNA replication ATP-dependent helicase Dna2